jgi:uncharacterized protein with von Willebrand factor type A (vWA) domain
VTARYDYMAWDGSQEFSDLDPEDLLAELTDDILAGGDLNDALRRVLRSGMRMPNGDRMMGLRELIERMRRRRAELLEEGDPGGELGRINEALDEVIDQERGAISELQEEARNSGDERRQEVTDDAATEHRMALDLLPKDLAGKVQGLQSYDFVSSEARQRFEELLEELRQQVAQTYFEGMSEAMSSPDPAQLQHMREGMSALNKMLEQREAGEPIDPSFEQFMEQFGDMFPGNPQNLDELLEQLAERMAAAQAMWNSMSPEQRQQLRALADSLLEDMDLRWQMERLSSNLQRAFPEKGWGRGYRFSGSDPMGMGDATDLASELGELDSMEEMLQSASSPAALNEVDMDDVRKHLGDDAARSLQQLAQLTKSLQEAGLIENKGGRTELTPKGVRKLGQRALNDLFSQITRERVGSHQSASSGFGHDREETTKPYEYGDPLNLHLPATLHNAVRRNGTGTPVRLLAEDFEIVETEALTRSATVLLVDLSMSMPMRDNFVPAKKMAMALETLISSKFPRDYLGIVGFSEVAREIKAEDLPTAMWDYVYGTNLQHALALGRRMLSHQYGTKQIIVVTDGEPTAHIDDRGEVHFNYPPVAETLRRTMAEVVRTTRAGITINTFALDLERTHYPFVEQIARVNGGRTFYTTADGLGGYVLVDFLQHRRVMRPAG